MAFGKDKSVPTSYRGLQFNLFFRHHVNSFHILVKIIKRTHSDDGTQKNVIFLGSFLNYIYLVVKVVVWKLRQSIQNFVYHATFSGLLDIL